MRLHSSQFSCAAGRSLLFLAFWGAQGCDIFPPVSLCCSRCRHQPLRSMGLRQHELLVTDAQSKTITHLQETAQGRTAPEVSWGEGTTSANSTAGPAAHAASVHRAGTEWFGGLCKTALLPRFPVSYTKQIPQIQHILTVLAKMAQTRINILSVTVPFYFFFCIFFSQLLLGSADSCVNMQGVSTLQLRMGTHISLVHHLITSTIARGINSVCKGWGKHKAMDPVHYCYDTSLDFDKYPFLSGTLQSIGILFFSFELYLCTYHCRSILVRCRKHLAAWLISLAPPLGKGKSSSSHANFFTLQLSGIMP